MAATTESVCFELTMKLTFDALVSTTITKLNLSAKGSDKELIFVEKNTKNSANLASERENERTLINRLGKVSEIGFSKSLL